MIDTVSYTESVLCNALQRAYRAPRIDVRSKKDSWVWANVLARYREACKLMEKEADGAPKNGQLINSWDPWKVRPNHFLRKL